MPHRVRRGENMLWGLVGLVRLGKVRLGLQKMPFLLKGGLGWDR